MKKLFLGLSVIGALTGVACGQGIALDDFESYANQAALDAVWTEQTAGITLQNDATAHSGTKYVRYPLTAARKERTINLTPSDSFPVVMDFWMRCNGSAAGRVYMQIGGSTASNLVQFGVYNSPAGSGWFARAVSGFVDTTHPWHALPTPRGTDWANLKVELKANDITFFVNGNEELKLTRDASAFPALTNVRMGSALSSAITVDIDDVQVYQAPSSVSDWSMY